MASRNVRSRAVWFWPLVAFLIGLLVGWLVIGWALWPVTWKNTLPQDLRPAERDAYLAMVAESLATSGDTTMAQERLASWPSDLLAVDLGRLQGRFAREDAVQAEQVQTLASALGLDLGATASGQTAGARPSAGSPPFSGIQWRTVCTTGLWVLLILLGVAAIVLLYRRWRASQLREAAPATAPVAGDAHSWSMVGGSKSTESAGDTEAAWSQGDAEGEISPRTSIPPWEEDEAGGFDEGDFISPPPRSVSQRVDQPSQAALAASAGAAVTATGAARPVGAPVPSGSLTKVSEVRALYQMGEPDYDEAFDVKDAGGAYIGECGVALVDPVGRGHDQAAALQVWLWDKSDPDTKVKVLMGEGAYRDTAMRDQLAKDQPSIAVKPGATFELDSYNLLLRGTVEKLDYADLEPAYGVFAELQLLLQVFRKG
jgi:hypothetical protein